MRLGSKNTLMRLTTLFFTIGIWIFFQAVSLGQSQKYILEKLGPFINSSDYHEISPVISLDGSTMFFTRVGHPDFVKTLVEKGEDLSQIWDAPKFNAYLSNIFTRIGGLSILDPVKSSFNQDIYISKNDGTSFSSVAHPGYPLNNAMPNSVAAITPFDNELIVINQFQIEGGMKKGFSLVRKKTDGTWSFPEPIGIENYYNSGADVSLAISSNGRVLILSMQRYDSRGETDLYVSFKTGTTQWSEPQHMGSMLNTNTRETTPFISDDLKRIFFASNRLGNSDIYMSERKDNTWKNWSPPRRLVTPINSTADDSQPFFNSSTGYLYFTSKRDGTSDIFRVKIAPAVPHFITVKGKIINTKTNRPIDAKIIAGFAADKDYRNVHISDDGTFEVAVPKGVDFSLFAEKPGYTTKEEIIHFRKDYVYFKDHELNLSITPIEAGEKLVLDPIYFERSTDRVLKKSYAVLNDLGKFLSDNYNVTIRIAGHTDNQGDEALLQKLSEDRAKAIKAYLVGKMNINPVRIEIIGYGAGQPITNNTSEKQRRKNRRVEVEITGVHELTTDIKK